MTHTSPATVRKSLLLRTILPAVLGAVGLFTSARAEAGSPEFYAATFFTAAVWFLTWLAWGNRRCFSGRALRETARGLALGLTLIVLFSSERSSCALSLLAGPVSDLLDNMRRGSIPITLATLIINGVGEELFFRDVVRRQFSDSLSPTPTIITQLALYISVTAAMGIPLLLVASVLIG